MGLWASLTTQQQQAADAVTCASLYRTLLLRCCYGSDHASLSLADREAVAEFREEARDLYRALASSPSTGPAFLPALLHDTMAALHATQADPHAKVGTHSSLITIHDGPRFDRTD